MYGEDYENFDNSNEANLLSTNGTDYPDAGNIESKYYHGDNCTLDGSS